MSWYRALWLANRYWENTEDVHSWVLMQGRPWMDTITFILLLISIIAQNSHLHIHSLWFLTDSKIKSRFSIRMYFFYMHVTLNDIIWHEMQRFTGLSRLHTPTTRSPVVSPSNGGPSYLRGVIREFGFVSFDNTDSHHRFFLGNPALAYSLKILVTNNEGTRVEYGFSVLHKSSYLHIYIGDIDK